jgi:excisionase family DNA binding protein
MKAEITQPILITVEETMATLRIGRSKLYALIKREGLPVHHFGRRTLIDPEELRPWLQQRRKKC